MKTTFIKRTAAMAIATALAAFGTVRAETTVTTTSTNGTISSFTPDAFVVKTESVPATTYGYSKSIQYVDDSGGVVTRESISPETPVTVHYIHEGDRVVADRVVVHKTTTTTTEPGRPLTHHERHELKEAEKHPEREARRAAEHGRPFPPVDPSLPKSTTTTTTTTERER